MSFSELSSALPQCCGSAQSRLCDEPKTSKKAAAGASIVIHITAGGTGEGLRIVYATQIQPRHTQ